jgi:hypothetical protein
MAFPAGKKRALVCLHGTSNTRDHSCIPWSRPGLHDGNRLVPRQGTSPHGSMSRRCCRKLVCCFARRKKRRKLEAYGVV